MILPLIIVDQGHDNDIRKRGQKDTNQDQDLITKGQKVDQDHDLEGEVKGSAQIPKKESRGQSRLEEGENGNLKNEGRDLIAENLEQEETGWNLSHLGESPGLRPKHVGHGRDQGDVAPGLERKDDDLGQGLGVTGPGQDLIVTGQGQDPEVKHHGLRLGQGQSHVTKMEKKEKGDQNQVQYRDIVVQSPNHIALNLVQMSKLKTRSNIV